MRKRSASTLLAAGLIGGTALGAVAFNPFISSADSGLLAVQTDDTTTVENDDAAADGTDRAARRHARLAEVLAPLVADGTLTQAQADAVIAALAEAGPWGGGGGHGRFGRIHAGLDVASTALGITEDELRTQLRAGSSIATVASERGVDVQIVIDALVADATTRIDEKVASGDLTAEQATEWKAGLVERITALVNGERPAFPGGGRGPGGFGPGGD